MARTVSPETKYARLAKRVTEWAQMVMYPHRATMFFYLKSRLKEGWALDHVYERVAAADSCGYDVHLRAESDGLACSVCQTPGAFLRMIRVTVELVPGGVGKPVHLGTAIIANDGTGTQTQGNYVAAFSSKARGRGWRKSTLQGFPRTRLTAWDLLYRLLHEAVGDRNT